MMTSLNRAQLQHSQREFGLVAAACPATMTPMNVRSGLAAGLLTLEFKLFERVEPKKAEAKGQKAKDATRDLINAFE